MKFESVYNKDGRLFFFDNDLRAICYSDDFFKKNFVLSYLPCEMAEGFFGLTVCGHDDDLFICNMLDRSVLKYSLSNNSFFMYKPVKECKAREELLFDSILLGDVIIQIPLELDEEISSFDLKTKKHKRIGRLAGNGIKGVRGYCFIDDNKIIAPDCSCNTVFLYDIPKEKTNRMEIPDKVKIETTCKHGNCLFCVSKHTLYIYENDKWTCIELEHNAVDDAFSRTFFYDDKLIILPRNAKKLFIYNVAKNVLSSVDIDEDLFMSKTIKTSIFLGCYAMENKLYLLPWYLKHIFVIDLEFLNIVKINSKTVYKLSEEDIFDENRLFDLEDFIASCEEVL